MIRVKKRDLKGQKFDRLLVLRDTGKRKGKAGSVVWLCQCECGTFIEVYAGNLKQGRKMSCGCYRNELLKKARENFPHFKDILGQRFNRLRVLERLGSDRHKKQEWRCLCDCGKEVILPTSTLISGKTKSCGCFRMETAKVLGQSHRYSLEEQMTSFYLQYARKSSIRGLGFELTEGQFNELVTNNCFYCGAAPAKIKQRYKNSAPLLVNGIDRVNNNEGYTPNNVVTACYWCNVMKSSQTIKEFLARIERIFKERICLN